MNLEVGIYIKASGARKPRLYLIQYRNLLNGKHDAV